SPRLRLGSRVSRLEGAVHFHRCNCQWWCESTKAPVKIYFAARNLACIGWHVSCVSTCAAPNEVAKNARLHPGELGDGRPHTTPPPQAKRAHRRAGGPLETISLAGGRPDTARFVCRDHSQPRRAAHRRAHWLVLAHCWSL